MITPLVAPYLLWTGLLLLLASVLSKRSCLAALGWAIFGLFWLSQPEKYLELADYFNVALVIAAGILCLYMASAVYRKGFSSGAASWASYAAAVCGLLYFPFSELQPLHDGLIAATTLLTALALQSLSVPVVLSGWNTMTLNGGTVEIILACTAIESVALFSGVILSVRAPIGRRLAALAFSTVTIYALNIARNGFVLVAYGWAWFGDDSFYIAHSIIAKAGSAVALVAVSYVVLRILPELLAAIEGLAAEIRPSGGGAA